MLFIGLALFFLWITIAQMDVTAIFADLFYLQTTLDTADSANPIAMGRYAAEAENVVTSGECRSDVIAAGLAFVLRDVDLQNQVDQYDAWANAMTRADRYVMHALSCNPGDGDLWARLAMIRQASSENAEQLSALMAQSALLAPSEMYVLRARFFVWRRASPATLDRAADTVERDIRTVLNYADPKAIIGILGNAGVDLKPHILAAWKFIPAARLADLATVHIDPTSL
jgi:hypothetical protein